MPSSTSHSANPHFYLLFQSGPAEKSKYSQARAKEKSRDGGTAHKGGKQATPLWCKISVKRELTTSRMRLSRGIGRQVFAAAASDQRWTPVRKNEGKACEWWQSGRFLSVRWDRSQGLAIGRHSAVCPADGLSKYEGWREQMDRSNQRENQRLSDF